MLDATSNRNLRNEWDLVAELNRFHLAIKPKIFATMAAEVLTSQEDFQMIKMPEGCLNLLPYSFNQS